MNDIALVYMVAGLSTRFGGEVKQFARIGPEGETLIEYSLNQAIPAGFTKIIFIVGEKTEKQFLEMFGDNYKGIPIYYAFQEFNSQSRNRPWGTTDALCSAKEIIDCPFVVCNGDDLYGKETFKILTEHLKNKKTSATIGYNLHKVVPEEGEVNRGIFSVDENNRLKSIKEFLKIKKSDIVARGLTENSLCSMNIFGLHPEILERLEKSLNDFKNKHSEDREIECLLPEQISSLIEKGLIIEVYPTKDVWFGVTNPEDEEIVRESLREEDK